MSGKAWALLSVEGPRRYAGNSGYDDDPERVYRYDSAVGNSRHVAKGDLIALRDRKVVMGVAVIQKVTAYSAEKERFHCPLCDTATIHERKEALPKFRCENKHEFVIPVRKIVPVINYEAYYEDTFLALNGISATALRSIVLRPSSQNSIEEIDPARLADLVAEGASRDSDLFETFYQWSEPETSKWDEAETLFEPKTGDRRNVILRSIAARQGQAKFRKALVDRYGTKCMATGCELMSVVEAAHIWPYRGKEDNHAGNGILLRSDIHTLFDLDLLGIEPRTMQMRLAPSLVCKEYEALSGISLGLPTSKRPSVDALALRWQVFCAKHNLLQLVDEAPKEPLR